MSAHGWLGLGAFVLLWLVKVAALVIDERDRERARVKTNLLPCSNQEAP